MATFGLHLFNNVEWADLDFELLKRDHAGGQLQPVWATRPASIWRHAA